MMTKWIGVLKLSFGIVIDIWVLNKPYPTEGLYNSPRKNR
jgi:hypothetical protein